MHVAYRPQAAFRPPVAGQPGDAGPAVLKWLTAAGIDGAKPMSAAGDTVEAIMHVAETRSAALIVVGSRRLSMVERLFKSSAGVDLARFARCPVLVVPPEM